MPWLRDFERRLGERREAEAEECRRRAQELPPVSDDLKAEIAYLKRRVAELESRTGGLVRYGGRR